MVGDILQPTHLLFVLVVALLVLGPKRLPEVARTLGKGIRDFRGAITGESDEPEPRSLLPRDDTPAPPPAAHEPAAPAAPPVTPATTTVEPDVVPDPQPAVPTTEVHPVATPATTAPPTAEPDNGEPPSNGHAAEHGDAASSGHPAGTSSEPHQ